MKYLITGLFLLGSLYAVNAPSALDRVEIHDLSAYEDIKHAR